jgi:hypothetical protein
VVTWLILLPVLAVNHNGSREKFDRADLVVILVWVAGGVLVLLTFALLIAAGVEFEFSVNHPRIADRGTRRQFYRDLIWLPPR